MPTSPGSVSDVAPIALSDSHSVGDGGSSNVCSGDQRRYCFTDPPDHGGCRLALGPSSRRPQALTRAGRPTRPDPKATDERYALGGQPAQTRWAARRFGRAEPAICVGGQSDRPHPRATRARTLRARLGGARWAHRGLRSARAGAAPGAVPHAVLGNERLHSREMIGPCGIQSFRSGYMMTSIVSYECRRGAASNGAVDLDVDLRDEAIVDPRVDAATLAVERQPREKERQRDLRIRGRGSPARVTEVRDEFGRTGRAVGVEDLAGHRADDQAVALGHEPHHFLQAVRRRSGWSRATTISSPLLE